MPVSLIIFSKNRPLQLDLCLNSLINFDAEYLPTVIYSCDDEYIESYEILKKNHIDVAFWPQSKSLFRDVLNRVVSHDCDYTCFLTDDCIVYRNTTKLCDDTLNEVFDTDMITSFSLRLGDNITKRGTNDGQFVHDPLAYTKGLNIFRNNRGMICYDRTQHFYGGYWNYPLSVDGHIFRSSDLQEWMFEICYLEPIKNWQHTPNELERALQRFSNEVPPLMVCDKVSSVVNSPNNRVQETITNLNGHQFSFSCSDLLKMYEEGQRIELNKLDFSNINCPHLELDILKGLE